MSQNQSNALITIVFVLIGFGLAWISPFLGGLITLVWLASMAVSASNRPKAPTQTKAPTPDKPLRSRAATDPWINGLVHKPPSEPRRSILDRLENK